MRKVQRLLERASQRPLSSLIATEFFPISCGVHTTRRLNLSASNQDNWSDKSRRLFQLDVGSWGNQEWNNVFSEVRCCKGSADIVNLWKLMDRAVMEDEEKQKTCSTSRRTVEVAKLLNSSIHVWKAGMGSVKARDVLEKIESYRVRIPEFNPDIWVYNTILDTAIKHGEPNAHELGEEMIQSLMHGRLENPMARPDTITFTIAIDALAKSGASDAPQRAEALLQQMKDLTANGWHGLKPNMKTYSTVMSAWANSQQPGAAQRTEALLKESPEPSAISFNIVMDAWSKSDDVGAADRCYQILQHVKKLSKINGNSDLSPSKTSYGTVIAAFAKNGRAKEAESIMQELLDDFERTNDPNLAPNRILFNSLINAWAQSGEQGAAQRAEALLQKMHTMATATNNSTLFPDVISFNAVINAWAKSNEAFAVSRAEAILQRMYEIDKSGFPGVKPNVLTCNTVLDCLAKSRSKDASTRAEALLEVMLEQYNAGDIHVMPNTISFNIVINAFAKSRDRDAAVKAAAIFARMKACGVQPNTQSYNSLISAWTNSRNSQAAIKAEGYLREMKMLCKSGDQSCKPSTITFNAVIHAWSTSRNPHAAKRALAVLEDMKLWNASGHRDCMPNFITYSSLLNVVCKSKSLDKAQMAWDILSEMEEQSIPPNIKSYNSAMMACAFSESFDLQSRERAFMVASEIFQRANSRLNDKPSAETYCFFFRAAAGLGHDKEVEDIYKLCCQAGFENDEFIQRDFRKVALHVAQS